MQIRDGESARSHSWAAGAGGGRRGKRRDCPLVSFMRWSGDPSEPGASAAVVQGEMSELLMCRSVAGRERVEVQSIARLCGEAGKMSLSSRN